MTSWSSPSSRPSSRPLDAGGSLVGWLIAYCHAEVAGAPKTTLQAKKRDFELFLGYFAKMMRSDSIDDWTRSVTLGFVQWLENEANEGRGLCPDLGQPDAGHAQAGGPLDSGPTPLPGRRPLRAGLRPRVDRARRRKGSPSSRGRRVLAAADKLCALQTQRNQQPRRKRALLVVLLETGMRISETLRLTIGPVRREDTSGT